LDGKPEGKKTLGISRYRWADKIRMDLTEIGVKCIYLAQGKDQWWALVNIVMNFFIPQNAGNLLTR
jgi:hypothetical protein